MAPPGLPFPSAAMLSASPSHRQALPLASLGDGNVMDMLSQILAPQLSQKLRDASPSPEPYAPQQPQLDQSSHYPSHQSQQYKLHQHQQPHQQPHQQQHQLPQPQSSADVQHHNHHHSDGVSATSFHRSLSAPYNAPGMQVAPQPHLTQTTFSSPFSPSAAGAFNFNSFLTSLSPSLEEGHGQPLPLPPVPSHALEEQELLQHPQRSAPPTMSTLPSASGAMKPLPSPTSAGPSKYTRSAAASGSGAINAITRFAVGPPNMDTAGFAGVSSRARRGGGGGGGGRGGGRAGSSNSERRTSNNSDRERHTPSANGSGSRSGSCDNGREHSDDGWSVVESKKHYHHRDHSAHPPHSFNPHSPTFASALSPSSMASLPARLLPSSKLLSESRVAALYVRTVEFDEESGEEMVVYVLNRPSAARI